MKKLYAIIMSLCLLVMAFPVSALAADIEYQEFDADASVSTDLTYSYEYVPQGNEFVVNIPTSLSWDASSDGNFTISLAPQSTISNGFSVSVFVSPDSFTKIGNYDCIKLTSTHDSSYYMGFTLVKDDLSKVFSSTENCVAYFSENSLSDSHIHFNRVLTEQDPSGSEYTGIMTFNIESSWF